MTPKHTKTQLPGKGHVTHLQQQHELEAIPELLLDALDEGARLPQV